MSRIEDFRPCLVEGECHVSGSKFMFEVKGSEELVILPIEIQDAMVYFNGEYTIKEIITELYRNGKKINFKMLFNAIQKLKKAGALSGNKEFQSEIEIQKSVYDHEVPGLAKPFFSKVLMTKWESARNSESLFLCFVGLVIFLAGEFIFTYRHFDIPSDFLKIDGSYIKGIFLFYCTISVLITGSSVVKMLLLISLTQRVYRPELRWNLFSFSLVVSNESLNISSNRAYQFLYYLASALSYFFVLSFLAALFDVRTLLDQMYWIVLFITLAAFDPYRKSDLTSLFQTFYSEDSLGELKSYLQKKSLLSALDKDTKLKDDILLSAYSTISILWSFFVFYFLYALLSKNFPNLMLMIKSNDLLNKIASILLLMIATLACIHVLTDIIKIIFSNLISPFSTQLIQFVNKARVKPDDFVDKTSYVEKIKKTVLFKNVSRKGLNYLIDAGEVRVFQKDGRIIVQDTMENCLHVLLSGSVDVVKTTKSGVDERVAQLSAVTVFGEIALLEKCRRTAHVIAAEESRVLTVDARVMGAFSKQFNSDSKSLFGKISLNQYFASSELFKGMPPEVASLFSARGKIIGYDPGRIIFKQGDQGNAFYLLIRGKVDVIKDRAKIAEIPQGSFFGEIALIANVPRTASIQTIEKTTVLRLSSEDFWKIISENLSLAIFIESMAEARMQKSKPKSEQKGEEKQ